MEASTDKPIRHRRSFKTRRTERTECGLTPAEKLRLTAYTERHGLSEADVLRALLLPLLAEDEQLAA